MFLFENGQIITDRLILRRFTMADAPKVAQICNTDKVYRGTLALPHPYTLECAESWIAMHDQLIAEDRCHDYAITDKTTGELLGCIGLMPSPRDSNAEIGYWMSGEHEGRGYATEAARAMIRFAFEVRKMHKVHATHYGSNPASGRVMQKCGMTYEGTQKEQIFKIDHFEDLVHYGIINPEA